MRSNVVLPEPDGPSIVKNSPSAISRSTPSAATTLPKRLRIPASRTAGGCPAALAAGSAAVAAWLTSPAPSGHGIWTAWAAARLSVLPNRREHGTHVVPHPRQFDGRGVGGSADGVARRLRERVGQRLEEVLDRVGLERAGEDETLAA